MILQVSPEAPAILRAGAAALLVAHIGGGSLGIASGWTAMVARKGGRLHRLAGNVFFVSMLTMAAVGATVAPFLPDGRITNTTAAVFTLYLTATAWVTVRRPANTIGGFEKAAVAVPIGIALVTLVLTFALGGAPKEDAGGSVYVFTILSALAAWCDLGQIRRGGLIGPARTARHLWRMSAALFVATGSFFLGQQKFLPEALRGTILPAIPVIAVLVLLVYWMLRTRLPKRRPLAPAAA